MSYCHLAGSDYKTVSNTIFQYISYFSICNFHYFQIADIVLVNDKYSYISKKKSDVQNSSVKSVKLAIISIPVNPF